MIYIIFILLLLGILFTKASTSLNDLPNKCIKNYTTEEFKECMNKNKLSLISKINLEAYDQKVFMAIYGVYDIILPKDGSIIDDFINNKPTLSLNSSIDIIAFLFDKNFMFPFNNPLFAKRTLFRIKPNTSIFGVNFKVRSK